MAKAIELVLWVLAGIAVMISHERPSKLAYGLAWGCLIFHIVMEMV